MRTPSQRATLKKYWKKILSQDKISNADLKEYRRQAQAYKDNNPEWKLEIR